MTPPPRTRLITPNDAGHAPDAQIEEALAQAAAELQQLQAHDLAYARGLAAADRVHALEDEELLDAERLDYERSLAVHQFRTW